MNVAKFWQGLATLRTASRRAVGTRERRQHERHAHYPLTVKVEGKRYDTVDWSLGGFRLAGFHRDLERTEKLEGNIDGLDTAKPGRFLAEVVWRNEAGHVGLRFLEITPAFFLAMSSFRNH